MYFKERNKTELRKTKIQYFLRLKWVYDFLLCNIFPNKYEKVSNLYVSISSLFYLNVKKQTKTKLLSK